MKKYQGGSTMLEGLISIAIFSFGVLGTMAFQANMLAQSTQTSYRLNASMHALSLIGAAEADATNYRCYVYPHPTTVIPACSIAKTYVTAWAEKVKELPGATFTPPLVRLDANDALVVNVSWILPNETLCDLSASGDLPARKGYVVGEECRELHTFNAMARPIG